MNWLSIRECFNKNGTIVLSHLSYSPDLVLSDFFLFSKLKTSMKEQRFETIEAIKENSLKKLLDHSIRCLDLKEYINNSERLLNCFLLLLDCKGLRTIKRTGNREQRIMVQSQ